MNLDGYEFWYDYSLPPIGEKKVEKCNEYDPNGEKTLIICETMRMVLDLTETLPGSFKEKPDFIFESNDYILMYGIRFRIYGDDPVTLKKVYLSTFSEAFERQDVKSIIWYSAGGTDEKYFKDVMRFRESIGKVSQKEYLYCDEERNKRKYTLKKEFYREL